MSLGESPVVLARIQLKRVTREDNLLCMHPESGKGIELAMNEALLHSFSKLRTDAVKVSERDMELKLSADAGRGAAVPERVN